MAFPKRAVSQAALVEKVKSTQSVRHPSLLKELVVEEFPFLTSQEEIIEDTNRPERLKLLGKHD